MGPEFHARFSVISKIYTYKIYNDAVMDPFHRHYAYHSGYKLNAAAMRDAAEYFIGTHDFSAFANVTRNDGVRNPLKDIMRFNVNEMVRNEDQYFLTFSNSDWSYRQRKNSRNHC